MSSQEQLWGGHLRGPLNLAPGSGASLFGGRTTINSGSASVTVSTTNVKSDSIILGTVEVGSVGVLVNSGGGQIVVNSIVQGTSFAFARADGDAVSWDDTIMWMLMNTS